MTLLFIALHAIQSPQYFGNSHPSISLPTANSIAHPKHLINQASPARLHSTACPDPYTTALSTLGAFTKPRAISCTFSLYPGKSNPQILQHAAPGS